MYCKKCGNKLKDNDMFCGNCGESTQSKQYIEQEVEIIEVEEKEKTIDSVADNNMINILVALTMVLSIISIIICSRI